MSATTSRRTLNKTEGSTNPSTKFLEWNSSNKCFSYYDKTLKEKLLAEGKTAKEISEGKLANVLVPLPMKIQFLEEFHTIKGFHEGSEASIYSNEIKTMKEELTVKSFKLKEPIAKGLYNDIKHEVKAAGGKYGKSVYALLDGEIVNLQLYGASISPFIFYTSGDKKTNVKGHSHLLETNFIEVKDFADKKKGANKYTEPIFSLGEAFTPEENELANEKYAVIANYFESYSKNKLEDVEVESEQVGTDIGDEGDLEF